MDVMKYRKWYLSENWGENRFRMVIYSIDNDYRMPSILIDDTIKNHYLVLTGKAFWINDWQLCVGYELEANRDIFRPIFSHKRQRFLDDVNSDIITSKKFWNKVKLRYYSSLCKIKKLPLECADYIVRFIY